MEHLHEINELEKEIKNINKVLSEIKNGSFLGHSLFKGFGFGTSCLTTWETSTPLSNCITKRLEEVLKQDLEEKQAQLRQFKICKKEVKTS